MLISAFIPVYNEEKRIAHAIQSIMWCDEIIVLDKFSTDRTVEIARSFGNKVKVHFMENSTAYNAGEWDFMMEYCTGDWLIRFTASDIMHPQLASQITQLISNPNFDADIINVPFRRYILGLESKRSPWYSKVCPMVFRKSILTVDKENVHQALQFKGKQYSMKNDQVACMYHLTHESVDIMMERHIRYWRGEANGMGDESLKVPFKKVLYECANVLIRKRSFLMGWDGIMLAFSYLTYYMMSFVYKWEKKRGKAPLVYQELRKEMLDAWKTAKDIQHN